MKKYKIIVKLNNTTRDMVVWNTDNPAIESKTKTRIPILSVLPTTVTMLDEVEIVCILPYWADAEYRPYKEVSEEINNLSMVIGFQPKISSIELESVEDMFSKLVDRISGEDVILMADLTGMTTGEHLATHMALSYTKNVYRNVYVERIVYGDGDESPTIHDISSLFYMREIISKFSPGMIDPKVAKNILGF